MLALTPPMGWNAWNYFGPKGINEEVVRQTADAMVAKGYRDAGYTLVSVDDCWMSLERDSSGRLQPDPQKFPSGMKAWEIICTSGDCVLACMRAPGF